MVIRIQKTTSAHDPPRSIPAPPQRHASSSSTEAQATQGGEDQAAVHPRLRLRHPLPQPQDVRSCQLRKRPLTRTPPSWSSPLARDGTSRRGRGRAAAAHHACGTKILPPSTLIMTSNDMTKRPPRSMTPMTDWLRPPPLGALQRRRRQSLPSTTQQVKKSC
ncbi:hypothetical protein BS78_01G221800 [Paspalum vaginatum]|nr:hypothetical protein BS78_01G221800 [Paspalum vaginatum]